MEIFETNISGYAFIIFDHEYSVRRLISASDYDKGKLLINITDGGNSVCQVFLPF